MRATSRLRDQRGTIFVTAMLALVVMLILGVTFTSRAINAVYQANRSRQDTVALSLAESGVELAMAEIYENRRTVPFSSDVHLASGDCHYAVVAPYHGIPDTIEIVATATTRYHATARVRVVGTRMEEDDVNRVFRGAIFSDNPLTLNGGGTVNPDADGEGGDIYSGGNITFNGTSFTMADTGHIYTTGAANWYPANVPPANVYEHVSPIPMPVIDMEWYRTNATRILNGRQRINGNFDIGEWGDPVNPDRPVIAYVIGDVSITGTYTGKGMIVATGTISVTGDVIAANPAADTIVLMSPTAVRMAGNCRVDGLVYAHNVTDATIDIAGDATVNGALIADLVTTRGGISVNYRDVWKELPLPGHNAGYTQLQQLAWQRLK